MAPNSEATNVTSEEVDVKKMSENKKEDVKSTRIVWRNVILFVYLHVGAMYGVYLIVFHAKLFTLVWTYVMYILSGIGVTTGAHRLWAHRAYKARLPLRIYLAICNSMAFQNDIFEWARDHRVHHKFSETDADPHNAKRGFFFAHMGWLLVKKHQDVIVKGKTVDVSDLLHDPVVRFQRKYYLLSVLVMCFLFPTFVPHILWGESKWNAFFICGLFRYLINLHGTWLVNSAAHLWGNKPYDREINPSENKFVSAVTLGEGHHNFHHTFPWDYSTSEWGWRKNLSTFLIDIWAKMGLAYDLKKVPRDIVQKRRFLNGDGSSPWYDEPSAMNFIHKEK